MSVSDHTTSSARSLNNNNNNNHTTSTNQWQSSLPRSQTLLSENLRSSAECSLSNKPHAHTPQCDRRSSLGPHHTLTRPIPHWPTSHWNRLSLGPHHHTGAASHAAHTTLVLCPHHTDPHHTGRLSLGFGTCRASVARSTESNLTKLPEQVE